MLKKELEKRYYEQINEIARLKQNQTPCNHTLVTCPNCGSSILILTGAYNRRLEKGRSFYCAVGHKFHYTS